ncbi:fibronectin type III domain-containing protein [Nonlabens xiamenensis]|uniref:fibronectin type III domain-containing protein n=1 Tax=Nonlabens xiamenensis TaxID=2341043 RepID=UPI000F606C30|nr:fibronectin type III domain-containing protein [Nonlabens xiamenensis]
MRTKLLLALFSLLSLYVYPQCDYVVEVTDFIGNDWDSGANATSNGGAGAGVDISLNGGTPTTFLVMNPGAAPNTETYSFTVNDGDAITVDYRAPQLSGDGRFRILDSEGNEVFASTLGQMSTTNIFSGTTTCPTCFKVEMLTVSNVTATSVDVSWTDPNSMPTWEVEYGPVGFTPGTAAGTVEPATSTMYTVNGLNPETQYDLYVRANCGMGDISSNEGPANFTTLESCPAPGVFSAVTKTSSSISFAWDARGNPSSNTEIEFGVSPYTQGGGNTPIQNNTGAFADVTGLNSNTSYDFYVRYDCGGGDFSSWTGPYTDFTTQSCVDVSAVTALNLNQTSVDVTWTPGGTETEWNIEFGPSPLTPGSGTTITSTTNPYTLTGLMPGTNYDICVTAVCSPTDLSNPVCISVLTPADYCNGDPLVDSGGVSGDYSGNEDITYTVCPDNPGDVVYVDFTQFIVEANDTCSWDSLTIFDGPDTNSPIIAPDSANTGWCFDGGTGTGDLTGMSFIGKLPSGCLTFRFVSDGFGQRAGFNANVTCAAPPSCPVPFDFQVDDRGSDNIDLSWTPGSSETEWTIEYGATGFTPGSGLEITATASTFNVPGLTGNTEYDFYLTSVCAVGDESTQIGPLTAFTACDALTAPYSTDYESVAAGSLFNCDASLIVSTSTDTSIEVEDFDSNSGSNHVRMRSDNDASAEMYYILPEFSDLDASKRLRFSVNDRDNGELVVGTMTDPNDATTFTAVNTFTDADLADDTYEEKTVYFSSLSTTGGYIAFKYNAAGTFDSMSIDDVFYEQAPSCPEPSDLTVVIPSKDSLEITWTDNAMAAEFLVEYRELGAMGFTTLSPNPTTNTAIITGLNSDTEYEYCVTAICDPAVPESSIQVCAQASTNPDYCGGDNFVDTGGTTSTYDPDANETYIICPDNAGDVVIVQFLQHDTEENSFAGNCYDGLTIYDGSDTTAPIIASPSGDPQWCWDPSSGQGTGDLTQELLIATSGSGCLTFVFTSDGSVQEEGWEATVTCGAAPTCGAVTNVSQTASSTDSVNVDWTAGPDMETEWKVEYGLPGFAPGTGTLVTPNPTSPSVVLTGLLSDTEYDVCISAVCSPGNEAIAVCTQVTTDKDYCAGDLFTDNGGANGNYTNNSNDTYVICPDNMGDVVSVNFSEFVAEVRSSGNQCWDGLTIYDGDSTAAPVISPPNQNTSNNDLWCFDGGIGTGDLTQNILTATGSTGCLTFVFTSDSSATREGFIARITCGPTPTCPNPTALSVDAVTTTTADLSWVAGGSETEWNVEVGLPGFVPGTGNTAIPVVSVTGGTPATTVTGLMADTAYEYYVQAICGPGDESLANGPQAFTTSCLPLTAPYFTDFENDATDSLNNCDGSIIITTSNNATVEVQDFTANSGDNHIYMTSSGDANSDLVYILPNFSDLDANKRVRFFVSDRDNGGLEVGTMTDPTDLTTFSVVETFTDADLVDDAYEEKTVYFNNLTTVGGYIAFKFNPAGTFDSMYLDDINYEEAPACPEPTNLTTTGTNATSTTLTWTDTAGAGEFEVRYREVGSTTFTTVSPNPTTNTAMINGLVALTDYEVCVAAICDPTNNVVSLDTCITFSTSPDYCAGDQLVDDGGISGQYSNDQDIVYTICPDNTGDVVYVDFIEFVTEIRSNGSDCWDGITVYNGPDTSSPVIASPNGTTDVWCWENASGTGNLVGTQLVGALPSGCLTFRFTSDGSGIRDGFIADVTCALPPSCIAPDTLNALSVGSTEAELGWNVNGTETEWEVEVQPVGVAQGTANPVYVNTMSTNPEMITGLSQLTTYDAYVRASCGAGDFSNWVGPLTFTTICGVQPVPYGSVNGAPGNDFTNFPGDCWSEGNASTIANGPDGTNGAWGDDDFGNDTSSPNGDSARINIYDSASIDMDWLVTPEFDLGAGDYTITFDVALTPFIGSGPTTLGSDDEVQLLITEDGGMTWNNLMTWNASSTISNLGQSEMINLSAYSGVVQFAFYATNGTVADSEDVNFYVDNFTIDTTLSNNDFLENEFVIYPNPVATTLNIQSDVILNEVRVVNLMGQEVMKFTGSSIKSIAVQELSAGMYILQLRSESGSKNLRFVKE